jgi:hypothetical protein
MKIKKKHEMKVSLALMVLVMTSVVTFVSASVNFGFHPDFMIRWFKSWGLAFIVALPVVMILMPMIKKIVSKFVTD